MVTEETQDDNEAMLKMHLGHGEVPVGHTAFEPEVRSPEELASISSALHDELARRHLGHKKVPILQRTSLSDIKDTKLRSLQTS